MSGCWDGVGHAALIDLCQARSVWGLTDWFPWQVPKVSSRFGSCQKQDKHSR